MIVGDCGEVRENEAADVRARYPRTSGERCRNASRIAKYACIEPVSEHILPRDHDPDGRVERQSCKNEALRNLNSVPSLP